MKTILKKPKSKNEANRILQFLQIRGFDVNVEENNDFMSDKYPYHIIGSEKLLGVIERHETVKNVVTDEKKRIATWNKSKSEWKKTPKRIRN